DLRRTASARLQRTDMVASLSTALAVCERTGAPTTVMLEHLAEALRDLHDAEQARRSAFAGPRSTARILLVLPLAGLGLGVLLGRAPPRAHGVGRWARLALSAGALDSGLPLAGGVAAVREAVPAGEEATALQQLATALGAGVPASLAGRTLPAELAVLARSAALAEGTGADLSRVLRSAARDARRGRARDAEVLAAQLAVRLVLPTGIALLPAFVALGIIPTVISLLGGTMTLAPGTG